MKALNRGAKKRTMSPSVQRDYEWSQRFIAETKRILGACLISEDIREDRERNSDLLTFDVKRGLELKPLRVASRIRKFEYRRRYGSEFTIRTTRPSGCDTEIDKLRQGWGDIFFYAFADEQEQTLSLWKIADLNVFRKCQVDGSMMINADGSSEFLAFKWNEFPPSFELASSLDWIINPRRWERFFGKVG
jgi:hypothetical protein